MMVVWPAKQIYYYYIYIIGALAKQGKKAWLANFAILRCHLPFWAFAWETSVVVRLPVWLRYA